MRLKETREAVKERDAWSCLRCGRGVIGQPHAVHHRKGRQCVDPHSPANMVLLCESCHIHIHAHPAESYDQGWMIRRLGDADPETVPVLSGGRHLLLTDEGEVTYV